MKRNCLKHGLKFTRFNFLIHYFIELPLHVANINQLLKILELKSEQGKKQKNSGVSDHFSGWHVFEYETKSPFEYKLLHVPISVFCQYLATCNMHA